GGRFDFKYPANDQPSASDKPEAVEHASKKRPGRPSSARVWNGPIDVSKDGRVRVRSPYETITYGPKGTDTVNRQTGVRRFERPDGTVDITNAKGRKWQVKLDEKGAPKEVTWPSGLKDVRGKGDEWTETKRSGEQKQWRGRYDLSGD